MVLRGEARLRAQKASEVRRPGEFKTRDNLLRHCRSADNGPPLEHEDVEPGFREVRRGDEACGGEDEGWVRRRLSPSDGGAGGNGRRTKCGETRCSSRAVVAAADDDYVALGAREPHVGARARKVVLPPPVGGVLRKSSRPMFVVATYDLQILRRAGPGEDGVVESGRSQYAGTLSCGRSRLSNRLVVRAAADASGPAQSKERLSSQPRAQQSHQSAHPTLHIATRGRVGPRKGAENDLSVSPTKKNMNQLGSQQSIGHLGPDVGGPAVCCVVCSARLKDSRSPQRNPNFAALGSPREIDFSCRARSRAEWVHY